MLILIAEAMTIFVAWLLLDFNTNRWIQGKTTRALQVSHEVALQDWSRIGDIPKNQDSALGGRYQDTLYNLSRRYFPRNDGVVYLALVDHSEEYNIAPGNPLPFDHGGKANQSELRAYATGKTTYTPTPISDDSGTYLAAYTPILHSGKVVGLVAAEYDSAPLEDFQEVVRSAFWLSVVPAILVSLAVAAYLASRFVEPMDVFRTIEETANQRRESVTDGQDDPWDRLTPKEKEVAELARQGLVGKEIAERLSITPETVKQHFKNVREKTGWSKVDLAVQASARRATSLSQ